MIQSAARLLMSCRDQPGIIAAVTEFLFRHQANITDLDQHSMDDGAGQLFMRLECQFQNPGLSRQEFESQFSEQVAQKLDMNWSCSYAEDRKRAAILVSRHDHVLLELLWKWSRAALPMDLVCVISNHPDLEDQVSHFDVPFHTIEVQAGNKDKTEQRILELIEGKVDLVILARYMQILSEDFVGRFPNRIINIHHSFLPAFVGADPYRQAYDRGVKIIGATSHYVTAELDAGPIIEQDVRRITHRHGIADLKAIGQDLERNVMVRAVKWHLEERIMVDGCRTVVFA
ncbi:MAG: formyltetrahydrofolate deformylase [Gammaproteobacteria bacterium]|nr:MAG: formyltetrahydrofolate deformylase [Gammaproteobacteria bacterium]